MDDLKKSRSNGEVDSTNHGITEIGIVPGSFRDKLCDYSECPLMLQLAFVSTTPSV